MGSKRELAQRRAKHSWYRRHQETLSKQLLNLPNIRDFPGLISGRKGRGKPGSLTAWEICFMCSIPAWHKQITWTVPKLGHDVSTREMRLVLFPRKKPQLISTLCGSQAELRLCLWPDASLGCPQGSLAETAEVLINFSELYLISVQTVISQMLRRASQWLPRLWGQPSSQLKCTPVFGTCVCKSLPNQGWNGNASFAVIRNDTEDVPMVPDPCITFPFSSIAAYSPSGCTL